MPDPAPRKTVLLVDDDPDVLHALERLVARKVPGLAYISARSAKEGLDILGKRKINIVVSDFRMPEIDGIAFLQEAKKRVPSLVTLMVTAYPTPELAKQAVRRGGVILLVTKPFDPEAFVRVLAAIGEGA